MRILALSIACLENVVCKNQGNSLENLGSPPWCLLKLRGLWSSIAQELEMLVKQFFLSIFTS